MLANIILIFTTISIVLLGIVVIINNPKNLSNRNFFYFCLSLAVWALANLLANVSSDLESALLFARLAIVPAGFLAFFFLLFSLSFSRTKTIQFKTKLLLIIPAAIISALSLTKLNIDSATKYAAEVTVGPLYIFMAAYLAIYIIWGIINFINTYRRSTGLLKEQVRYVLIAILLVSVPGFILNGFLPVMGISEYSSFGPIFIILMVAIMSYAILKKGLMDIRAAVARSVAFVFSVAFVGVIYGLIAFGMVDLILPKDTPKLTYQLIYIAAAVTMAFSFGSIKKFFEKLSNHVFYRDKYDSQLIIDEIGHVMASEIRISQLSNKVSNEISKKLRIASVDIIIFDKEEVLYSTKSNGREFIGRQIPELKNLGSRLMYKDSNIGKEKSQVMKNMNISISVPLKTSNGFLGYLLLGEKQSGQIYTEEDLKTIKIIANELSVAVENAKAFLEIKRFNDTLQDRVDKATRSLQKANSQLKELDQAKDEFISMASHQLRTPLTTVKGYVSMLDEGDFGELTKEQKQSVDLALDGSNRMARLIDDLLNVSRMEAGKFYIDATKVDLEKAVEQEVNLLQTLAETKKVKLIYNKPKTKISIMHLDDNKTRQVIMNLIDNAIHYSQPPNGGGKVGVSLEENNKVIEFRVVDNGIGVPKDQQNRLFTKMFRAKNAKEVRPDGTGLGLFLVKRVVEDQGGSIIFESKPGKGSTFGFRMPVNNSIKVDQSAKKKLTEAQK